MFIARPKMRLPVYCQDRVKLGCVSLLIYQTLFVDETIIYDFVKTNILLN